MSGENRHFQIVTSTFFIFFSVSFSFSFRRPPCRQRVPEGDEEAMMNEKKKSSPSASPSSQPPRASACWRASGLNPRGDFHRRRGRRRSGSTPRPRRARPTLEPQPASWR